MAGALREAGMEVVLFQPRQVRAFALFRLKLAKNDRLDARRLPVARPRSIRRAMPPRSAP
ncbi:IS110 family transposase [Sphingobium sp. AP50]|uniref:IS110 family transposase n=1 Tax=Sphingobium sp. AP50 TaxID=1884369 RepID=UPI001C431EAB